VGGVEVADAVDARVDVNISLSPTGFPPAAGTAALGEERPRDRGAQLVVALAPRVVRGRVLNPGQSVTISVDAGRRDRSTARRR
jgi:hypothetical protein